MKWSAGLNNSSLADDQNHDRFRAMMDFAAARANMIESQIRPNGITDTRVIEAMAHVPREAFAPEPARLVCYMDENLSIARTDDGTRYLMQPMTMARLLQMAMITEGDIVLDVGCATGYSTAVLSLLAQSVVAVEQDADLAGEASRILSELNYDNAAVINGPHCEGCPGEAPFDIIFLNGHVSDVPDTLLKQLKPDGRLVAVTGPEHPGRARVWIYHGATFSSRTGYDASVPELAGFARPVEEFVL